jgi:hypothetical protein
MGMAPEKTVQRSEAARIRNPWENFHPLLSVCSEVKRSNDN